MLIHNSLITIFSNYVTLFLICEVKEFNKLTIDIIY